MHDELDGNRLTTNELTPFFHFAYDLYIDTAPIKTPKNLHQIKKQCHSHFGNQTFGNLINMTIPISGNDP